jgi:hypothetical protein
MQRRHHLTELDASADAWDPGLVRLALALILLLFSVLPGWPAGLEVAERVYDAGKVDRGATVRHEFVLKNVGPAEVAIDAKPG